MTGKSGGEDSSKGMWTEARQDGSHFKWEYLQYPKQNGQEWPGCQWWGMKNRASNTDGYQGRTTTEKWVSDNVRKKSKTKKKKKKKNVQKNLLTVKCSHLFIVNLLNNYYKQGNALGL